MSTSSSIPASISDLTDNSCAIQFDNTNNRMPLSPTLPTLQLECNDRKSSEGSIRFPIEYSTLPLDCKDLLNRLLEFHPDRRIRSIFALQRIAFFMGFNFDDAKKKKINPLDFMDSTEIY